MGKWRYGVILDAGSSGTRVHIYKWLDSAKVRRKASAKELQSLPELRTEKEWTKKIHQGVSTFAGKADLVGPDHLQALFEHALKIIPSHAVADTPIFLLATAGMRLLPEMQRKELLAQICAYTQSTTKFLLPDCNTHVQVISGETEGLYGWVAANYLLGGFDQPEAHDHGKGHHTYGFLDMGGASAQIAFAPNSTEVDRHANDLKLVRMRTVDGQATEYKLFVTTWLGFGVNQARKRYVDALLDASATHDAKELPDPCLPVGLVVTKDGTAVAAGSSPAAGQGPHLLGTGRFDECLRATFPLLEKEAPCADDPCLLNGIHVPAIDFDVNHFVGVSEFWHTTHEVFGQVHQDKAYDAKTYQKLVEDFCSQDWKTISKGVRNKQWGKKVDEDKAADVCFKASWLINMLHSGIGVPRGSVDSIHGHGKNASHVVLAHPKTKAYLSPFQAVDKIHDTEVSWTLGKMVLYAASQVPPMDESLPVGFGSNVAGIPQDFQYAGSKDAPILDLGDSIDDDDQLDWHDTLLKSDSPRRVPGLVLFLLILFIAGFLWCGRDRRTRWYRWIGGAFGRAPGAKRRRFVPGGKLFGLGGGGRSYERVMESGEAANDFELGDVDSDLEDSDSSNGSRNGRASGWASPRTKPGFEPTPGYFDHIVSPSVVVSPNSPLGLELPPSIGNAMDRSGLVVRTESRERLGSLGSERRSRATSPTRQKSPLTPIETSYD
ncbi:MAG: Golgi apyrase [Thelocarpon superellum]|nr:MAG: Golgi apyrase [Thelocarpon superellum]